MGTVYANKGLMRARKEREKAKEKNKRICQGESALMSPSDLLHSYAQQPSTQGIHSTVFLDKYILKF